MRRKRKLELLKQSKNKVLERLTKVKERLEEEGENEDAWPGHGSTQRQNDLNQLEVLTSHLKEIEKELKEFTNT